MEINQFPKRSTDCREMSMDTRSEKQKTADDLFERQNYEARIIKTVGEFLACRVSTNVLRSGEQVLSDIADIVIANTWDFCNANRAQDKEDNPDWWPSVARIEADLDWDRLKDPMQPLTVRRFGLTFAFGDQRRRGGHPFGGGCHRAIAVAVRVTKKPAEYRELRVLVERPRRL